MADSPTSKERDKNLTLPDINDPHGHKKTTVAVTMEVIPGIRETLLLVLQHHDPQAPFEFETLRSGLSSPNQHHFLFQTHVWKSVVEDIQWISETNGWSSIRIDPHFSLPHDRRLNCTAITQTDMRAWDSAIVINDTQKQRRGRRRIKTALKNVVHGFKQRMSATDTDVNLSQGTNLQLSRRQPWLDIYYANDLPPYPLYVPTEQELLTKTDVFRYLERLLAKQGHRLLAAYGKKQYLALPVQLMFRTHGPSVRHAMPLSQLPMPQDATMEVFLATAISTFARIHSESMRIAEGTLFTEHDFNAKCLQKEKELAQSYAEKEQAMAHVRLELDQKAKELKESQERDRKQLEEEQSKLMQLRLRLESEKQELERSRRTLQAKEAQMRIHADDASRRQAPAINSPASDKPKTPGSSATVEQNVTKKSVTMTSPPAIAKSSHLKPAIPPAKPIPPPQRATTPTTTSSRLTTVVPKQEAAAARPITAAKSKSTEPPAKSKSAARPVTASKPQSSGKPAFKPATSANSLTPEPVTRPKTTAATKRVAPPSAKVRRAPPTPARPVAETKSRPQTSKSRPLTAKSLVAKLKTNPTTDSEIRLSHSPYLQPLIGSKASVKKSTSISPKKPAVKAKR